MVAEAEPDRQPVIEVTSEMASVGRAVLVDCLHDDTACVWELPDSAVAEAYIAMERARLRQEAARKTVPDCKIILSWPIGSTEPIEFRNATHQSPRT